MITNKEARKRLEKSKYFKDYDKHCEYRLPVIEWYLANHNNININGNKVIIEPLISSEYDKVLTCQAFESLKKRFVKKK